MTKDDLQFHIEQDRKRVRAILTLPESKGREKLAQVLAYQANMSVDAACATLKVAPLPPGVETTEVEATSESAMFDWGRAAAVALGVGKPTKKEKAAPSLGEEELENRDGDDDESEDAPETCDPEDANQSAAPGDDDDDDEGEPRKKRANTTGVWSRKDFAEYDAGAACAKRLYGR